MRALLCNVLHSLLPYSSGVKVEGGMFSESHILKPLEATLTGR